MLLRRKTQIIVGITLLCLILVLYAVSRFVLLDRFADLEEQNARQEAEQAQSALLRELGDLDAIAFDWAAWDDTYAFIQDTGKAYIQSNLTDETFTDLQLDVMLLIDPTGQIVFDKGFDGQSRTEMPIPAGLYQHITPESLLLQHANPQSSIKGIILIPEGPMLVASRPILTSQETGPIRGTLIVGQYLDNAMVERLTQITHFPLNLSRVDDPQLSANFEAARAALSGPETIFVQPLSTSRIAGYTFLKDIYGRPALILRVTLPRDIYRQGQVSLLYFLTLLAIGLIFGGVAMLFLERTVLSRLTRLSRNVSAIGVEGDLAARVTLTGEDELARLAAEINRMLTALEHSQHELQESETKFRRVIAESADGIVLTDEQGVIVEWNQGQEQITGVKQEQALGQFLWDVHYQMMPPDKKVPQVQERLRDGMRELFQAGRVPTMNELQEQEIQTPSGTRRFIQTFAFPIQVEEGWMSGSISRDITARKEFEMALSQHLLEQEMLIAVTQLVSSSLEIDKVLRLVAEQMAHFVDAASCAISDWDPEIGLLTVQAEYIRPDQVDPDDPIQDLGQSYDVAEYPLTARAMQDGKPFVVYVDDFQADAQEQSLLQRYQWYGVAGIPLIVQDQVIGLAEVYMAEHGQSFTDHDLRMLQTLANQVAVAIENARLFTVTQANEAALRNLSLRLIKVQEQERRYIAQELHDELGQLLTATKINVDLARRKLAQLAEHLKEHELTALQFRLDEAGNLTDKVLTNVRAMTVDLRPTLLDDMGIIPTLRWYLGRFTTSTGIKAHLDTCELPARLQTEIETTLYRVVQEALTNVARHAQASQVWIQLNYLDKAVTASVEDNGRGFDVKAWSEHAPEQQSLGLTGIRERALLLNGHVDITSQPQKGTRIEIELPAHFRAEDGG